MKKLIFNITIASLLSLALLISSCSKDSNEAGIQTGTTVRLNIGQSHAKAEAIKGASVGRRYTAVAQSVEIPFDNQYTLVAT